MSLSRKRVVAEAQDAHARANCRDENGTEPWACGNCDCTERLEARLMEQAAAFLPSLRGAVAKPQADGQRVSVR